MRTKVYAWARPITKLPWLDHTFITDYNPESKHNSIVDVKNSGSNFWYCWGDFHSDRSTLIPECQLRIIEGNLSALKCICNSNDSNCTGTLKAYLKDGVCHQVSNQILYMASPRVLVAGVKGWRISNARYGHYGKRPGAFFALVNSCKMKSYITKPNPTGNISMNDHGYLERLNKLLQKAHDNGDSDEEMVRKERYFMLEEFLGSEITDEIKNVIVKLMEDADYETEVLYDQLEHGEISGKEYAEKVNKVNRRQFNAISEIIGPENYEKLFQRSPEEKVDLGDPDLAAAIFDK